MIVDKDLIHAICNSFSYLIKDDQTIPGFYLEYDSKTKQSFNLEKEITHSDPFLTGMMFLDWPEAWQFYGDPKLALNSYREHFPESYLQIAKTYRQDLTLLCMQNAQAVAIWQALLDYGLIPSEMLNLFEVEENPATGLVEVSVINLTRLMHCLYAARVVVATMQSRSVVIKKRQKQQTRRRRRNASK